MASKPDLTWRQIEAQISRNPQILKDYRDRTILDLWLFVRKDRKSPAFEAIHKECRERFCSDGHHRASKQLLRIIFVHILMQVSRWAIPMTDLKYRLYDWALTGEIKGSKNSVAVARRVPVYLLNSHYDLRGLHGPLRTWPRAAELTDTLRIPRATVNRALKRLEIQDILRKICHAHWIVQFRLQRS